MKLSHTQEFILSVLRLDGKILDRKKGDITLVGALGTKFAVERETLNVLLRLKLLKRKAWPEKSVTAWIIRKNK